MHMVQDCNVNVPAMRVFFLVVVVVGEGEGAVIFWGS